MMKIGIDIGGTTIKGARFESNTITHTASTLTNGKVSKEAIIESLFKVIDTLYTTEVNYIGVASAGNINNITGECLYATDNLKGWTGMHIKNEITNRYPVACKVENDAIAALIAEASLLNQSDNITMITLGTGVGGASIVNGSIVRGNNFNGGRWGHICLEVEGIICNCGSKGCAEQYLSATALYRYALKFIPDLIDCKHLFKLYKENHTHARNVLTYYSKYLNALLKTINHSVSPELIIIGGGLALSAHVLVELIDQDIKNVVFAKLSDKAGIYGASIL